MTEKTKVPTTTERFYGVIERTVPYSRSGTTVFMVNAAEACADIHHANVQELLEQVAELVAPENKDAFTKLTEAYTA